MFHSDIDFLLYLAFLMGVWFGFTIFYMLDGLGFRFRRKGKTPTSAQRPRPVPSWMRSAPSNGERGFTLVELAIVMMIIGLLIGGVLKGQELLANARVTSTISQVKGFEAATTSFRDVYSSLPGDMINAQSRLPNCTSANNCNNGDGNNIIGPPASALLTYDNGEPTQFWKHLLLADLISGVTPDGDPNAPAWGETHPSANVGGGFHIAYSDGTTTIGPTLLDYANGHFVRIQNAVGSAPTTATGQQVLSPLRSAQIDRKMDDGSPENGIVIGHGNGDCTGASYNEQSTIKNCNLLIAIQR